MKIKKELQEQKEKEFELDLSFSQWLDYFIKKPTNKELDDMESEIQKNKPQNNQYYQPLQGA